MPRSHTQMSSAIWQVWSSTPLCAKAIVLQAHATTPANTTVWTVALFIAALRARLSLRPR